MERIKKPLHVVKRIILLKRASSEIPDIRKIFDPDHLDPALCHPRIIAYVLIGVVLHERQLECCRFHHTMVQRNRTELPVGKQRRLAEIIDGIGRIAIVLWIEFHTARGNGIRTGGSIAFLQLSVLLRRTAAPAQRQSPRAESADRKSL